MAALLNGVRLPELEVGTRPSRGRLPLAALTDPTMADRGVPDALDYDGFPTFLWLERGTYDVGFFLPGFQTIVRQYTVRPGAIIDVEDRMTPGESVPPAELMRPKSNEVRDARIQRNEEQEAEAMPERMHGGGCQGE